MVPMSKPWRLAFAAVFLVLAACETPLPPRPRAELSYAHLAALKMNVATVEVASDFTAPLKKPNVEHLLPITPEAAMKRWAGDRLRTGGGTGVARFTVRDASVVETPLAVKKGIVGAFTREQAERYTATVEGTLRIIDDRGFQRGTATARVSLSRTVAEDASLNEREMAWFRLVEDLMKSFDAEMERNVRRHLGGHLM